MLDMMVYQLINYMERHDYISWYIDAEEKLKDGILLYSLIEMTHGGVCTEETYNEGNQSELCITICIAVRNRIKDLIEEGYFEEEE